MNAWSVQDAQARFGELLDACGLKGPQWVIRDGCKTAVLVSAEHWHRLQDTVKPSLKELLLLDTDRLDALAPPRCDGNRRPPPPLD
jgi:antitoxin Phd